MIKILTKNSQETQKIAEILAKEINKKPSKKPLVLALAGELGAGKTTFIQGLAKGFGIREKVLSPTFLILKKFKIAKSRNLVHIDLYRLNKPKELLNLGFREIIKNPKNIVVIEWADKIKKLLPRKNIIRLDFKWLSINKRKIIIR